MSRNQARDMGVRVHIRDMAVIRQLDHALPNFRLVSTDHDPIRAQTHECRIFNGYWPRHEARLSNASDRAKRVPGSTPGHHRTVQYWESG
jgi:hypothetical protein